MMSMGFRLQKAPSFCRFSSSIINLVFCWTTGCGTSVAAHPELAGRTLRDSPSWPSVTQKVWNCIPDLELANEPNPSEVNGVGFGRETKDIFFKLQEIKNITIE